MNLSHLSRIRFMPKPLPTRRDFRPWQGKGETILDFLAVVRAGFLPAARKMQTKLQVAPHPVRMAAFKKVGKKCWQRCSKEERTLITRLAGVQMTTAKKQSPYDSAIPFLRVLRTI